MPPCAFEERNSQYLRTSGNLTAKKQALWVRTECHCHHLLLTIPSRLGFSPRLKGIRDPQMSDRVAMGFLMTPETHILPLLARYLDKQMGKLYTGSLGSKLHVKVKTSFQMDTSTGEQTLVMSFLPADGYSAKPSLTFLRAVSVHSCLWWWELKTKQLHRSTGEHPSPPFQAFTPPPTSVHLQLSTPFISRHGQMNS